jgi:L-alanine-DL-glutamate epimerase-like enolase superfamily enzyme
VALWDLKARRAGLAAGQAAGRTPRHAWQCYNTSGRLPVTRRWTRCWPTCRRASRERGIGGIKIKVGQPDRMRSTMQRVQAVHKLIDDAVRTLMVDANQQWDRVDRAAFRAETWSEPLNLTWIEEPLDAYDARRPCCAGRDAFDTPIATGEMLTSAGRALPS